MLTEPRRYLDSVRKRLKLDSSTRKEVLSELYTHFEDRVEELQKAGLSEEEASKIAAESFGSFVTVGNELNEVHNSSNWVQTLVAASPHLLFALLFALHQWANIGWLMIIVMSTAGMAVYGWQHDKPTWFFTWLGYALMPLLVVGLLLLQKALGSNTLTSSWWAWLLLVVYFPIILWLFIHILLQVLKRDWLLGTLMALPVPPLVGWFITAQWRHDLLSNGESALYGLEPWIALSLLTLAGIVVLFNRFKQRRLKAGVLLISGLAVLIFIACSSAGSVGVLKLVFLASIMLFLLLGPALLEHRVANQEADPWDYLLEHRPRG